MKFSRCRYIIFTDLDGTLIDEEYSYRDAEDALSIIKKREIPLILCTSKTRAEIEIYRNEIGINDPFISENGGAIFIPENYFENLNFDKRIDQYCVIELGIPYTRLRGAIERIRKSGYKIKGFGDMSVKEISTITNLGIREAELSKKREYDEPFIIQNGDEREVLRIIREFKLMVTKGGRFYHLTGNNDKGKAVRILTDVFRKNGFDGETIGLGDSENDFPMLRNVDIPILIRDGPREWNTRILKILGRG